MTTALELLRRMRPLLASAHEAPGFAGALRELGQGTQPVLTLLGQLLLATQRRDADQLERLWAAHDAAALRADPCAHFIAVWCRRWTLGLPAVRADLRTPPNLDALPSPWVPEWRHLAAWAELLGDRTPRVDQPETASIPLVPRQPIPVVECRLLARRAHFILDTGAPTSVVDLRRAAALGVDVRAADARESTDGAGHRVCLYPAVAREISFAGVRLEHVPVHAADLAGLEADGILSPLDLFRAFAVELDGERGELHVHRELPRALPSERVELSWQEGSPLVPVSAHGRGYSLLVDTGAGANLLCQHVSEALGLTPRPPALTSSRTAVGRVALLGSLTLPWALAHVAQPATEFTLKPCAPSPEVVFPSTFDGYLGWPWFARRRAVFSPGGRTLYF